MEPSKSARVAYDWMLGLSAEGWAWEFLRRNPDYRQDYVAYTLGNIPNPYEAATCWGLVTLIDPDVDARSAAIFWSSGQSRAVLQLVIAGETEPNGLSELKCKTSVLALPGMPQRHVLYSCEGRFLQLEITGDGAICRSRYMVEALPEHSGEGQLTALRKLTDLLRYKRMRPHLYSRQRRGRRLAHIAAILDSYACHPAYRLVARDVFGNERAESDWDSLRDHIRRAVAAGRKLSRNGYLEFLR